MSYPRFQVAFLLTLTLALATTTKSHAAAVTVFNSLDFSVVNQAPWVTATEWPITGSDFGPGGSNLQFAFRFVPSQTVALTNVVVPLWLQNFNPPDVGSDRVVLKIHTEIDNKPGTVLETILAPAMSAGQEQLVLAQSALNPTLTAGEAYWLSAAAPYRFTRFYWLVNRFGDNSSPVANSTNGTDWTLEQRTSLRGAFQVSGLIPEPASLSLVVVASTLLRRRRV